MQMSENNIFFSFALDWAQNATFKTGLKQMKNVDLAIKFVGYSIKAKIESWPSFNNYSMSQGGD